MYEYSCTGSTAVRVQLYEYALWHVTGAAARRTMLIAQALRGATLLGGGASALPAALQPTLLLSRCMRVKLML